MGPLWPVDPHGLWPPSRVKRDAATPSRLALNPSFSFLYLRALFLGYPGVWWWWWWIDGIPFKGWTDDERPTGAPLHPLPSHPPPYPSLISTPQAQHTPMSDQTRPSSPPADAQIDVRLCFLCLCAFVSQIFVARMYAMSMRNNRLILGSPSRPTPPPTPRPMPPSLLPPPPYVPPCAHKHPYPPRPLLPTAAPCYDGRPCPCSPPAPGSSRT